MKLNLINYIKANHLYWIYAFVGLFFIGAIWDNSLAGYIIAFCFLSVAVFFTLITFFSYRKQQEND